MVIKCGTIGNNMRDAIENYFTKQSIWDKFKGTHGIGHMRTT
jgi:hypothetical protein